MNFNDVYLLVNKYINTISNFEVISINKGNSIYFEFDNWEEMYNALNELLTCESLKDTINSLLEKIPTYCIGKNKFTIDSSAYNGFTTFLNKLKIELEQIIKLGNNVIKNESDENSEQLKFKLPKYDNFQDFTNAIEDINKIMNQCSYFKCKNQNIRFINVDIGSSWLIFAIFGSGILIKNIMTFIDKALVIYSHYLNIQSQKEDLRQKKMKGEEEKKNLDFLTTNYKDKAREIFKSIEKDTEIKLENDEDLDRNLLCVEILGKLINKGLQILPSISSKNENKVLFEPLKTKYLEIDKILGLEQKNDIRNNNDAIY